MRRKLRSSSDQATLLGKTFSQMKSEIDLKQSIEHLQSELQWILHLRTSEDGMIITMMGIERYMGSRLPWFLNLVNDVSTFEEGCPKPQDYRLGYYGKDLQPGTKQFILDRLEWAEKIIGEELETKRHMLATASKTRCW